MLSFYSLSLKILKSFPPPLKTRLVGVRLLQFFDWLKWFDIDKAELTEIAISTWLKGIRYVNRDDGLYRGSFLRGSLYFRNLGGRCSPVLHSWLHLVRFTLLLWLNRITESDDPDEYQSCFVFYHKRWDEESDDPYSEYWLIAPGATRILHGSFPDF